jgi:monoamine oxidase
MANANAETDADADYIIIGAGLAGLYAAYKIRKAAPTASILVLEAAAHPGGRAAMARFGKTNVVLGAGIGRAHKDVLLTSLLKELKVPFGTFPITHRYGPGIDALNVAKDVTALQKVYTSNSKASRATRSTTLTFEGFAKAQFGEAKAAAFFESLSYTDMLQEDAGEVLQHYGLDDNYDGQSKATGMAHGMYIPWSDLVQALIAKIGHKSVIYNATVTKIQTMGGGIKVTTANATYLATKKLILAATQPTLRALLPKEPAYKQIGVNTFLRAYAKVSPASRAIMAAAVPGYTVVKAPLQKIIPMNPTAGIYMVAYSDNASADALRPHLQNTAPNRRFWARRVEAALALEKGALEIEAIMGKYWEVGTHYVKPGFAGANTPTIFFHNAQHPLPNVIVVGEVVSAKNRGWVEGALESVEAGLLL